MSLRRFPWKMPRLTDNSYRLFASPPSESTEGRPEIASKSKSETEIARIVAASRTADGKPPAGVEAPTTKDPAASDIPPANPSSAGKTPSPAVEKKPEVIKGPWRLLRLLPRETRHIIGRMLEIDPRKRATMAEVLEDPWVAGSIICRQDAATGQVISAPGHTHTLEPPSAPAAPAK